MNITPQDIFAIRNKAQDTLNNCGDADVKLRFAVRQSLSDVWAFIDVTKGKESYDIPESAVAQLLHDELQTSLIALLMTTREAAQVREKVTREDTSEVYKAFTARFEANQKKNELAIGIHEVMQYVNRLPRFNPGDEFTGTDGAKNCFIAFMSKIGIFVMWCDINSSKIFYFCETSFHTAASLNGMFRAVGEIETMEQVNRIFAIPDSYK